MAQVYADENVPASIVEELRNLGHEVMTLLDAGLANQALTDAAVLALAMAERRILLTLNRKHFIRLHHTTPTHAGIIVCTFDPDFIALAHRINAALQANPTPDGELIRINRPSTPSE